jgi:hypothetical protein
MASFFTTLTQRSLRAARFIGEMAARSLNRTMPAQHLTFIKPCRWLLMQLDAAVSVEPQAASALVPALFNEPTADKPRRFRLSPTVRMHFFSSQAPCKQMPSKASPWSVGFMRDSLVHEFIVEQESPIR